MEEKFKNRMSGLKPFYPLVIFPVLKYGVVMLYS